VRQVGWYGRPVLDPHDERGPAGDDAVPGVRRPTFDAPTRDLLVIAGAVLLCIGFAPVFVSAPYSPRFALLLGFLPLGVVGLIGFSIRRDRAALACVAFIVVAFISSLLSDHVRISLVGQMGKESSTLLLIAFLGWWAIGRATSERGRAILPYALVVGFGINAFVGLLQVTFDNSSDSEFGVATGGRAVGLTANPVQFGALMAAGAAICATFAMKGGSRRWVWWGIATGGFVGGINLSGTRIAMISIVLVLAALVAVYRSWRFLVPVAASVVGVLLSNLAYLDSTSGGASTSRITASFDRTSVWIFGLKSFLEQPVLGYGPGGFRGATQGRYTAEFVRTAAKDELRVIWFDAHNVAIEYLVATGVIGVAMLAVFGWFALRKARGPLLAAFVAIAITWTMQPLSVSTAPIALLCLGAAAPLAMATDTPTLTRWRRPMMAAAGTAGVVLALGYAFIDLRLDAAISDGDAVAIEDAARPFGNDAVVADLVAQGWANAYFFDGAERTNLVKWAAEPALREPDRPYWWSKLASTRLAFQDYEGAREALDSAIALQPWSPTAWPLMLELGKQTNDPELEALATEKVCELQLSSCPTDGG
jgi:O-antigen ligase